MTDRRKFIALLGTGMGVLAAKASYGQGAMVSDSDSQAVALGYHVDASKTDKAKYVKYAPGQQCGNCALFQGKPADKSGGCPLFAGKQVASSGWCSAYAKKA